MPAIPALASIGIGRTLAYSMINAGTVPAVKLGARTMIRRADFDEFVANLPSYRAAKVRAA